MNIVAKSDLDFQGIHLQPITNNAEIWLTASQIGYALQYADDKAVQRIYSRHADEFTEKMTGVVRVTTPYGEQMARAFSLRGAHLIAMFARTDVAKEFRRWVLDILEREAGNQIIEPLKSKVRQCTATQLTPLRQTAERLITTGLGKIYPDIWKLVHRRFDVEHIHQLQPEQISEAIEYLNVLEGEYLSKASVPAMDQKRYHFPVETADPHDRRFGNAWMTPHVILDERNRAPELELLEALTRDGYDISGAQIRIHAMYAIVRQFIDLQNGLADAVHHISAANNKIKNLTVERGSNVSFSGKDKGIVCGGLFPRSL
ncbi:BRO-N domain-containing protein [Pantoea agglomerans]